MRLLPLFILSIVYHAVPITIRVQKCRLVGYAGESGSRVYRVYDENTKQELLTRDVVFDEGKKKELSAEGSSSTVLRKQDRIDTHTVGESPTPNPTTKESPTPTRSTRLSLESAEEVSMGDPLPPIDPQESSSFDNTDDKDKIVVR